MERIMKRKIYSAAVLAIFGGLNAFAQDTYDAARVSSSELNGTARYVGMGGAMGALGGDLSAISSNPAGLGIYRSNDIAVTGGINFLKADGFNNSDKNRLSFDQAGIALTYKFGNYSSLKYINYSFNYKKNQNFFDVFAESDTWNGNFSQTQSIAEFADGVQKKLLGNLAGLAYDNCLIEDASSNKYTGLKGQNYDYVSNQTGSNNEYAFSVAANWNDKYFLGATFGVRDISYTRDVYYAEDVATNDNNVTGYDMYNYYHSKGDGFYMKLGGIIRPFDDSSFRIGATIETPTWYSMTDENAVAIDVYGKNVPRHNDKEYGNIVDYVVITPWKFGLNLGHTIGTNIAIGAEYEFADYSHAKLCDPDGYEDDYSYSVNNETKEFLKGVHSLKLGAEFKLTSEFAIRGGYNYVTSVFDENASRVVYGDDWMSETSFTNNYNLNRYTCGLGYRGKNLYADVAYQFTDMKREFCEFYDSGLAPLQNKLNKHQVSLTVGFRF